MNSSNNNNNNNIITFECLNSGIIYVTIENDLSIRYYITTINLQTTYQYQHQKHNLYESIRNHINTNEYSYLEDEIHGTLHINFTNIKRKPIDFYTYDKPLNEISPKSLEKYIHHLHYLRSELRMAYKNDFYNRRWERDWLE